MSHLSHKLAMGLSLALILSLLMGCPQTQPPPKPNGPGPNVDGFAPDDFEATLRWLALQVEPVFKADNQQNKLRADEELGKANATFAKLAGRKVNWRIKVAGVTEVKPVQPAKLPGQPFEPAPTYTVVQLENYDLGVRAHLVVSALATSTPVGRPSPGGSWGWQALQEGNTLEVGKVISKARATRLAKGDKVLVSGKVAYCVGSGADDPTGWRFIALCLVEAKSPD
jgi:hypothetical protein